MKKILKVIGIILLFIILLGVSIFGYSWIRNNYFPGTDLTTEDIKNSIFDEISIKKVSPKDNAYLYVKKINEKITKEQRTEISRVFVKVKKGETFPEEIKSLLDKNKEIFILINKAFSKKYYQTVKSKDIEQDSFETIFAVRALIYMDIIHDFMSEDYKKAVNGLANFNEFLAKKSRDENASLATALDIVVSLDDNINLSLLVIKNKENITDNQFKKIISSMKKVDDLTNVFEVAIKDDYKFNKKAIDVLIQNGASNIAPFSFKPNKTIKHLQEINEIKLKQNNNCAEVNILEVKLANKVNSLLKPTNIYLIDLIIGITNENYIGELIIFPSSFNSYFKKKCNQDLNTRLYEVYLAMTAYEKENGKFPDKLEQLVPEYFKSIPLSNFTNKPIEYDLVREIIENPAK